MKGEQQETRAEYKARLVAAARYVGDGVAHDDATKARLGTAYDTLLFEGFIYHHDGEVLLTQKGRQLVARAGTHNAY